MRMFNARGEGSVDVRQRHSLRGQVLLRAGDRPQEGVEDRDRKGRLSLELAEENARSSGSCRMERADPRAGAIPTPCRKQRDVDAPLEIAGRTYRVTCVFRWQPPLRSHSSNELTYELVLGMGPKIEHDRHFPNRVKPNLPGSCRPRGPHAGLERGSGETMACGTDANAVCVADSFGRTEQRSSAHCPAGTCGCNGPVIIMLPDGRLSEVFSAIGPMPVLGFRAAAEGRLAGRRGFQLGFGSL